MWQLTQVVPAATGAAWRGASWHVAQLALASNGALECGWWHVKQDNRPELF